MVCLQPSVPSYTVIGPFHWPGDTGRGSQTTRNGALDMGDFRFSRHLCSAFHPSRLGQVTSQHPYAGSVPAPRNAPTVPAVCRGADGCGTAVSTASLFVAGAETQCVCVQISNTGCWLPRESRTWCSYESIAEVTLREK